MMNVLILMMILAIGVLAGGVMIYVLDRT